MQLSHITKQISGTYTNFQNVYNFTLYQEININAFLYPHNCPPNCFDLLLILRLLPLALA